VVAHIATLPGEHQPNHQQEQHRMATTSLRMAIQVGYLQVALKAVAEAEAALPKLARLARELATQDLTAESVEMVVKASQTRCVLDHPSCTDLVAAVRAIGQMATEEPMLAMEAELMRPAETELMASTRPAVAAELAGEQAQ
jgi:hypothetical protein